MKYLVVLAAMVGLIQAESLPHQRDCAQEFRTSGLSNNYHENVAHSIHSMTVQGLRMFNPRAGPKNFIPTVNLNVSAAEKVVPHAPDNQLPTGMAMVAMRTFDKIMSHKGITDDGMGSQWSPVERVAHVFHMTDLWEKVRRDYTATVLYDPPTKEVCGCLTDVQNNGVEAGLHWMADQYAASRRFPPCNFQYRDNITLLKRPMPKLTDAKSWSVWRERLMHYYMIPALHDVAMYMFCATKDL